MLSVINQFLFHYNVIAWSNCTAHCFLEGSHISGGVSRPVWCQSTSSGTQRKDSIAASSG